MTRRRALLMAAASITLLSTPPSAIAINRDCPTGQVWNANQGACVKKKQVTRRSPAEKYYLAIKHLEKTIRRASPKRGVALLRAACRARYADACTHLGFLYLNGRHVVAAPITSKKHYARACSLGDPHGCLGVADILSRGLLGKVDHRGALRYLDAACKRSNGKGCYELGEKYRQGLGVRRNADRASEFYARAYEFLKVECPNKIAASCDLLGKSFKNGLGTARDLAKSYRAFKAGCEYGSGGACYRLGDAYYYGHGTPRNRSLALRVYANACTKYDSAPACNDAVVTATQSKTTTANRGKIQRWAQRACTLDKRWCMVLGFLYSSGKGGVTDQAKATKSYVIACNNGSRIACRYAAARLVRGRGTPKNPARGETLYQRGCDQGDGASCGKLGQIFHEAKPPKRNYRRASALFRIGCRREDPLACHYVGFQLARGLDGTGTKKPAAAVTYLKRACALKRRGACHDLGKQYVSGRGLTKDVAKGLTFLNKACNMGYSLACTTVGNMFYHGNGVAKNERRGGMAYARACKHGASRPCYWVDQALAKSSASAADRSSARMSLERACAGTKDVGRNETACVALANIYAHGGHLDKKDPPRGFKMFEASCSRKHAAACVELAQLYAFGIGIVQDKAKAKQLLTSHCNQNSSRACTILGWQLYKDKNYDEAARLYRRACDADARRACTALGYAHYTGQGVEWDVARSKTLYEKSCKAGDANGCTSLAELYEWGAGATRDLARALELYRKGCTPSESAGCAALGRFYERGIAGLTVDLVRAETEYKRACTGKSLAASHACGDLARLYARRGGHAPSEVARLLQKSFDVANKLAYAPYGKYVLGTMYRDGVTVVKQPAKATELFVSGCGGYDVMACLAAGDMEMGKRGGTTNLEAAAVHYARACAASVDRACASAKAARTRIAEAARKPTPDATPRAAEPTLPLKPTPRAGCGCGADGDGGQLPGGVFLALALTLTLRRKRATAGRQPG